jgi:hypothetical protein
MIAIAKFMLYLLLTLILMWFWYIRIAYAIKKAAIFGGLFALGKFDIFGGMEKILFKLLARLNKWLLPSFTKKRLDISKARKWQLALIGWRYYVTSRALD